MEAKDGERTWKVGMRVERDIDSSWFPAKIEAIDTRAETVTLRYLDDGNEEQLVPFDEIRPLQSDAASFKPAVVASLPRPLQGLIEDDEEVRKKHQPRIIVHDGHELPEDAIIISGPENAMPTGSGLKGIRWLRRGQS